MNKSIEKIRSGVNGKISVPGDKSISHRSVMLAALGQRPVRIRNFLEGADCLSTVAAMRSLGAEVKKTAPGEFTVTGHGLRGLTAPKEIINAGNSGTTLRLLLGLLAPQPFSVGFSGDESLSQRPMGRVIKPLRGMGAEIVAENDDDKLPLRVDPPRKPLQGIHYAMPVASAQVKSALLLAGLYATGPTTVAEPYPSRDHTERLLRAAGAELTSDGNDITIYPAQNLTPPDTIEVPGDISSAAYWLAAASIIPGSDLLIANVGINPTRTGILDIMIAMGAKLEILRKRHSGGEPLADIRVQSSKLRGVTFGADIMPRLIDEVPVIAVMAAFAEGDTVIKGAGELRVKETDRLAAIERELNRISPGTVSALADGLAIRGNLPKKKSLCQTYDDHRMAMSLAILGAAGEGIILDRPECVNISYPDFYATLAGWEQGYV